MDVSYRVIERFSPRAIDGARLAFRGGLVLRGPRQLGGLSGLLVDGDTFLAVTDVGHWVSGRFVLKDRRLVGLADVAITPRLDVDGSAVSTKRRGDAEALARDADGILVLLEQPRELLRYPSEGLAPAKGAAPQRVPLGGNADRAGRRGMEAMARLPSGKVIILGEGRVGNAATVPGAFVGGRAVTVRRVDGFAITGMSALPGGDVVIVERRYGGGLDVEMRVRRIGADAFAGGGPADGPVLLRADFSAEIDNMEAIAATIEDGEIILTLLSDDNRSFWQRSLILRFAVTDPLPRANPRRIASR